jgi:hypothetical protein
VSGSKNMKIVLKLHDWMHHYFKTKDTFNTERNSFNCLKDAGVEMQFLKARKRLIRGF